jgi:DNA (cytosine-5)-methyltransferase 3A
VGEMNVLSLFDGISCGRVALERAGIKVDKYYASEIEPNAIKVTQQHYPDTIQLGDVTKIDFNQFKGKIDLLIGGSPCQDMSIAKANREGLRGERSGLFFTYVNARDIIQPKYFLLENNYSMPKEACEEITSIMGVEPIMINSALVSAQSRKRLYWTNIPNVTQPEDKGILLKDIIESGTVDRDKALCLTRRYAGFQGSQSYLCRRYFGKSFGQAVFEGDIDTDLSTFLAPEIFQALVKGLEADGYSKQ